MIDQIPYLDMNPAQRMEVLELLAITSEYELDELESYRRGVDASIARGTARQVRGPAIFAAASAIASAVALTAKDELRAAALPWLGFAGEMGATLIVFSPLLVLALSVLILAATVREVVDSPKKSVAYEAVAVELRAKVARANRAIDAHIKRYPDSGLVRMPALFEIE